MAGLMGRVTDLHLRDIRCFAGDQSSKLGRITLLLGENNSGKSTFLGCYKALVTLANFSDSDGSEPFGGPPVHMSRFETIARSGADLSLCWVDNSLITATPAYNSNSPAANPVCR